MSYNGLVGWLNTKEIQMNAFDYDPAGEEQFDIYYDVDQAYEDRSYGL